MKYVAKELKETADVSRGKMSNLQILKYSCALAALLIGGYMVLGWAADFVAMRISPEFEKKLTFLNGAVLGMGADASSARGAKAEAILKRLTTAADVPDFDYKVVVIPSSEPNALALPGGTIALTSGLFDAVDSEEAMAMVLGHELGHYVQRDHLRGLGRGILLAAAMAIVFGSNEAGGLVRSVANVAQSRHGRKQEQGADEIGIELLVKAYGHAGGATSFFESLERMHTDPAFAEFLSTHPSSPSRIENLIHIIAEEGFAIRNTRPVDWDALVNDD